MKLFRWLDVGFLRFKQKFFHDPLRELAEQQRCILDNLLAYVALLDPYGVVLEVNRAPLVQGKITREQVIGQYFYDTPWWAYDEKVRTQLKDAIDIARNGHTVRYDVMVKMGDRCLPIDFQISPLYDAHQKVIGLLPTAVDLTYRKRAEEMSRRYKSMIDVTREGFWITDGQGQLLEANQAYAEMSGYTLNELAGMRVDQLEALEGREQVEAHLARIIAQNGDIFETRHRHKQGHAFDVEVAVNYIPEMQQYCAFIRDISERKRAEAALRIAAATFETQDAVMVTDADARIIQVNEAFQKITGYRADEIIGQNPKILSSGNHAPDFYAVMWQELLEKGAWQGELWDRRKNGEVYPKWTSITALRNSQGEIREYIAIFSDITERKHAEAEIHNLAFYDALTKLPNRRLLLDRFAHALSCSERPQGYGAILYLDLDRFKILNDTFGHHHGDLLLVEVGKRIRSALAPVITVARIGGDEFIVLVEDIDPVPEIASQKISLLAETLRSLLAKPYQIKGRDYFGSTSIGIALFHGKQSSVEEVLKQADMALYQAKNTGRNTCIFFDPSLQEAVESRAALEKDLRQALEEKQFEIYYQIQVDNHGVPTGAEALIRWMHPVKRLIPPSDFIPVAEECMLIIEVGKWVMDEACRRLALWSTSSLTSSLSLAVNVSGHQFAMHDFVSLVSECISRHRINPRRLKLEITETVVINDLKEVIAKMRGLKELGVCLSLDDFGTGYSSLQYLKQLPLDQLKIDKSFVRDMFSNESNSMMVRSIIDMARNFGLEVIAEGVESEAQLAFLKQHECMAYQGYFFSKPVPLDDFMDLLESEASILLPQT